MRTVMPTDGFRDSMLTGLTRRPRAVPCKYLYDAEGSALFERITELEEYYPTRTEIGLLSDRGADIARVVGAGARVVEFGAGSMRKTRLLLAALDSPAAYVPVDVAREPLLLAARRMATAYPAMTVAPMVADFNHPLVLPPDAEGHGPVLGFFPGSTIGNMMPGDARDFLRRVARLVGPGGRLLVGVDLAKDPRLLEAAYDDSQGVTTAFIRNLLARANRELDADFDIRAFDHRAWWNAREGRVEINLIASRRQTVSVAGRLFAFRRGDAIHVEDCYKYTVDQFRWLARLGGFVPEEVWVDSGNLFSLHMLLRA
ncbi:MAG: L-histidine N(alpha)-methyltransferase [Rhodospirillaceae bacterium]|nr:L-histidine N(alpha)-methyltransferase [Rhodospirillales bacterium]